MSPLCLLLQWASDLHQHGAQHRKINITNSIGTCIHNYVASTSYMQVTVLQHHCHQPCKNTQECPASRVLFDHDRCARGGKARPLTWPCNYALRNSTAESRERAHFVYKRIFCWLFFLILSGTQLPTRSWDSWRGKTERFEIWNTSLISFKVRSFNNGCRDPA